MIADEAQHKVSKKKQLGPPTLMVDQFLLSQVFPQLLTERFVFGGL